jgi:UDP-glucose 4-epimerase
LALLEHGYEVIVVDSLYNASETSLDVRTGILQARRKLIWYKRIELLCGKRPIFHKVDITDEEALDKVFAAHPNIDSVIHFAALKVRFTSEFLLAQTS